MKPDDIDQCPSGGVSEYKILDSKGKWHGGSVACCHLCKEGKDQKNVWLHKDKLPDWWPSKYSIVRLCPKHWDHMKKYYPEVFRW